jgi:hypothetical protein
VGAALTLAMLAFGTLAGAAASNPAGTFGALRRPLTLLIPPRAHPVATTAAVPPPVETSPTPEAGAGATVTTEPPAEEPDTQAPASNHAHAGSGSGSAANGGSKLPPVKHVFVIMLADQPYAQTFGPESPAHYLSRTLERRGELLVRAYAVAEEELANEVALVSGLGPTPQVAANCPVFTDILPTPPDKQGQYTKGAGCIYPPAAQTIGDQLEAKKLSWRVYAESMNNGSPARPAACGHPEFGAADPTSQLPSGGKFATFRNPFSYFDGVLHSPACAHNDVGLEGLAADLRSASRTPAFSYIVPDLCHDGRLTPCEPGAPSGLPAADAFLRRVVPEILASPGYRKGGLLIVTTDQAPATGEYADSSSCCLQPRFPAPAVVPAPAGVTATGATPTGATPTDAAPATGAGMPAATTPTTPSAAPTAPGLGAATPTATTPTPAAPIPNRAGIELPPTGGGQVGALLLSPFVKPGTSNQEPVNDFTLLRTIEDIFGLPHLGYAGAKGVSSLEASVFSAYTAG